MFAQVKLLHGFPEPLWYSIPFEYHTLIAVGTIIQVPIRNQIAAASIVAVHATLPTSITFTIKPITGIEPFPQDPHYEKFLHLLGTYHQVEPLYFLKRIRQFVLHEKPVPHESSPLSEEVCQPKSVILTDEQKIVCDFAQGHIDRSTYAPIVLHGITGSGKTEVYKKLITHALASGKTALLLLPEVTLALQFAESYEGAIKPDIPIFSFHSAISRQRKNRIFGKHYYANIRCLLLASICRSCFRLPILVLLSLMKNMIRDIKKKTSKN